MPKVSKNYVSRINRSISFKKETLEKVDNEIERLGMYRSEFFEYIIKEYFKKLEDKNKEEK